MGMQTIVNTLFTIVLSFIFGAIGFSIPFILDSIFLQKRDAIFDFNRPDTALCGIFLAVIGVAYGRIYSGAMP